MRVATMLLRDSIVSIAKTDIPKMGSVSVITYRSETKLPNPS